MNDPIDREAAIDAMKSISDSICEQQAIDALCELPSAQPEIIRCKDCKYYIKSESYCDYLGITISDLDFCSLAGRRTDGSY